MRFAFQAGGIARGGLVLIALAALAACGKTKEPKIAGTSHSAPAEKKGKAQRSGPLKGYMLTALSDRAVGPFMAKRPAGPGVVAWMTPTEGVGRRIVTIPLGANGEPAGPEHTIANTSTDSMMLTVRTLRGAAPGFVVAWTVLTDQGKALWAVAVHDDGTPRAKPTEIARTTDDVVWIDVVPTDTGAVCVWAEETASNKANIGAAALDTDGHVRGAPAFVARNVLGWHVLELPTGLGLSTVTPLMLGGEKDGAPVQAPSRYGTLSFLRIDAEARPAPSPTVIEDRPIVSGDVEAALEGDRVVFAWTARTSGETFIAGASLDGSGAVSDVRRLVTGRGTSRLLGLAANANAKGAALMWESSVRSEDGAKKVYVAPLSRELTVDPNALPIARVGTSAPELAASGAGYAVLATMRDCDAGSLTCLDAPVGPALVRTDARGIVVQRESLNFGSDPARVAWNLSCVADGCVALAASGGPELRVRSAFIEARANIDAQRPNAPTPSRDAGNIAEAPAPPEKVGARISDLTAFAQGERIVDMAVAKIGAGTMLATLASPTSPAEGASSMADKRANAASPLAPTYTLSTRAIDADGVTTAPVILSTRALGSGGVAMAAAARPEDGGVVVWTARENDDQQVHVTRVDRRGRRTNDVQLTTAKGDASDVTVTWVKGGWLVAWVDGRDGNGEIYATKVDLDLKRLVREERLTNAPGDASDLVALGGPDGDVWLAWADPRENPEAGMADIFTASVRAHDAKRKSSDTRVLGTVAHSRSPQLALTEAGLHVAWIEEAPLGVPTPTTSGYGAMVAALDEHGVLHGNAHKLAFGGQGAAVSVALGTMASGLRAVVARSMPDAIALDAVDISPGGAPGAAPLLRLDGPPSLDVALVLHGDDVFFNDAGPAPADNRGRRARIAWPGRAPK